MNVSVFSLPSQAHPHSFFFFDTLLTLKAKKGEEEEVARAIVADITFPEAGKVSSEGGRSFCPQSPLYTDPFGTRAAIGIRRYEINYRCMERLKFSSSRLEFYVKSQKQPLHSAFTEILAEILQSWCISNLYGSFSRKPAFNSISFLEKLYKFLMLLENF